MCMCASVCEREIANEVVSVCVCVNLCLCECVCVCVRERERKSLCVCVRERERESDREGEKERNTYLGFILNGFNLRLILIEAQGCRHLGKLKW